MHPYTLGWVDKRKSNKQETDKHVFVEVLSVHVKQTREIFILLVEGCQWRGDLSTCFEKRLLLCKRQVGRLRLLQMIYPGNLLPSAAAESDRLAQGGIRYQVWEGQPRVFHHKLLMPFCRELSEDELWTLLIYFCI